MYCTKFCSVFSFFLVDVFMISIHRALSRCVSDRLLQLLVVGGIISRLLCNWEYPSLIYIIYARNANPEKTIMGR